MVQMSKLELTNMQIKRIEKEIRDTPYHKGTEHHIGRLRARLAKFKDNLMGESTRKGGGGGVGYSVKKQGDATVVLVGPPSVGKSTLINKLTNTQSKVAPYAFTTVSVIPGMLIYNHARIQILDVPGLIKGAEEGKGRGREVLSVVRGCDLLAFITDVFDLEAFERITKTLYKNGVRVNEDPPRVLVEKKIGGGLTVHSNLKQELSRETIKEISSEMGIKNAEITLNERVTTDRLIDSFSQNRVYIPAIYIVNKADIRPNLEKNQDFIYISAENGDGVAELQKNIWGSLRFITIFLVHPDEKPSNNNPMVMRIGDTLMDTAREIGSDFADKVKGVKIWGAGSKFPSQEVSLKYKIGTRNANTILLT
jgi:uncharacterized protein